MAVSKKELNDFIKALIFQDMLGIIVYFPREISDKLNEIEESK